MQSSKFGPPSWEMMFYVAAGYDFNETPKYTKDENYINFFRSIGDVLPCRWCRESYKIFFESLPIKKYMQQPSCSLIKYVYDLKNLVNNKLFQQEQEALKKEFEVLSTKVSTDDPVFWKTMREKGHKICYTKPAPPFEQVVEDLMKYRAGCNNHMKTCREPLLNNMYPPLPNVSMLNLERKGLSDRELYHGGKKVSKRSKKKRISYRRKSRKISRNIRKRK